jgi:putative pyruvate formate lyase activating enzyme
MQDQSRREFVKSCICFGISGLGSTILPCLTGCRVADSPAPPPARGRLQRRSSEVVAKIDPAFEPPYHKLHESGELRRRGEELWARMAACDLCPRECGAARLDGEEGFCQASSDLEIAAHHPHLGEEQPLVGQGGSGTVFFANCGLRCVFCINWEISQGGEGQGRSIEVLADMMLELQAIGCHNINIVTPTHYSPHILLGLDVAAGKGLRLPLVYNTCGWERLDVLKRLESVVDVYLPDYKYSDGRMADKYSSGAETYPEVTQAALLEMHRQVGVARPAPDGLMYRGLMIRHLVMPNDVSGTKKVIEWIAANLPKDTYLNIMSQYRPMHEAFDYPEISRRLTREEYSNAVRWAREAGLTTLDIQGMSL